MVPNPALDRQAAENLIGDMIAGSLRTLSAYLEPMPGCILASKVVSLWFRKRRRGLPHGLCSGLQPHLETYRAIETIRAADPRIPAPRALRPTRRERLRPTRLRHQFIELRGNAMAASSDDTRSASRSDRRKPRNREAALRLQVQMIPLRPRGDRRKPPAQPLHDRAGGAGHDSQALIDRLAGWRCRNPANLPRA